MWGCGGGIEINFVGASGRAHYYLWHKLVECVVPHNGVTIEHSPPIPALCVSVRVRVSVGCILYPDMSAVKGMGAFFWCDSWEWTLIVLGVYHTLPNTFELVQPRNCG